ncbi:MAG: hypothetical protein HYX93_04385 [Chloroflexi bacterium]|nr:hypothetical protein [Chloroflexota bacterium]
MQPGSLESGEYSRKCRRPSVVMVLLALLVLAVACTQTSPAATETPSPTPRASTTSTSTPTATLTPTATASPTPEVTATHTFVSIPTPTTTPFPTPTATLSAPSGLESAFRDILERVTEIRGLEPLEDIIPRFMTRDQLMDVLIEDLDDQRDDILKSQRLLKVLDLIPQDADLLQMLLDLYTEQVLGFYDTETRELYVIKGLEEITPLDEVTLAHEYVHALQQQHFDIHTMSEAAEDDSEASSALTALIEGDASVVQVQYMASFLTSQERRGIFDSSSDSSVFDSSPYAVQQDLLFPYSAGQNLVTALLLQGGWEAVDAAYRSPPVSTEQVLHPAKYLQGEAPTSVALPDLATVLGAGWIEVYTDVMGEFSLRTYLETRTSREAAQRASTGWGGDRFALLEGPGGEQALAVLSVWDSERDAQELFDALDDSDSVPSEGFLGLAGDRVLWVLSPSSALTESVRAQFPGF